MSYKHSFIGLVCVWSIVLAGSASAQRTWNQTGGGTFNWATTGNWTPAGAPGFADDARVTNDLVSAQVITSASGIVNFMAISNGLGTAAIKVIINGGGIFTNRFGGPIGTNATLEIANNTQWCTNESGQFSLRPNNQPGTLILSNGAVMFVKLIGDGGASRVPTNSGTIIFTASAGQNSQINYGPSPAFTNTINGTVVKTDTGTGSFVGNFGNNNQAFINEGTVTVLAGTLRIDPRGAFSGGGFRNASTGLLQVDTNAVAEIRRNTNAWTNPGANFPTNFGTIFMNGGELRTFDTDGAVPGTNTTRLVVNASGGVIRGNGLLDFSVRNESAGSIIEARDGMLTSVTASNNNGTWVSTNFGGNASTLNFTTGGFDLGAGTLLNSNSNLRLTGGANMTISTSYRQNWGTIDFAGVGNLWIANSPSAESLTNEFVIKKTATGIAAIITGYGSGGPPPYNYGFYNRGTIDLSSSGRFSINTSNSFSQPFNNSGNVFIGNVSTLRVVRTSAAWGSATSPTNSGTITLSGGVLELFDDAGLNTARFLRNAGTITGTGNINASLTNGATSNLTPGLGIGSLNIAGSVVSLSNSALNIELDTGSTQCDLLAVAGSVTLDTNSKLNISGGVAGNVYTVMTYAARSGTFGTRTPGYDVIYGSTLIAITFSNHTITASAGANGSIAPSGAVIVTNGNNQTFNITPDACYQVADVLVDGSSVGATNSYTFFGVTSNRSITASFSQLQYTITTSAGSGGTIAPSGPVIVNCGDTSSFTITANAGHHIVDVLADGGSVGAVPSYDFTNVTSNHNISASFAIDTYTINATAGNNGTINPSGAVSVDSGNDQTFTFTADSCYHVNDVFVDGSSAGAVSDYTFTNVVAGHTIDASFAVNTYTIVATAGTNGTISPLGTITINCGTNQDFTITADAGYPTVDVLVDSVSLGAVTNYTFTNVTANHTIDASFATELFRVLSISRQGSDVLLTWPAVGGHNYTVQSTDGSNAGYTNAFSDLTTITIPGIGESTTNHLDSGGATNSPSRFYRIKLEP